MSTSNDQDDDGRPPADRSQESRPPAAYIGLGANLGDRLATLNRAVDRLATLGVVESVSPVYETEPVDFADQPAFLNAVLCLTTNCAPEKLMSSLLEIEQDLGRVRTLPNAPRTVDLDLLLYGDVLIDQPDLTVPHPRLHERAFVLVPLIDIAPDLLHPELAISVGSLLRQLGPVTDVRRTRLSLHDVERDT
jgi:2-amino-4-hydroxy-6-hydroxymethyldihydropteridine diphosphokinase